LSGNAQVRSLTVAAGGHLTVGNVANLAISAFGFGSGSFVNLGTTTVDHGSIYFGIINVPPGEFTNRGLFTGSGGNVVIGAFHNDGGTVQAGSPVGQLGFQRLFSNAGPTGTGTIIIDINGRVPGTEYDQIITQRGPEDPPGGTILGGQLVVNVSFAASPGDTFRILDNQQLGPISGTFTGLPEGATVTAGGQDFQISYVGGDGNDVTLTREPVPVTFVWDGQPDAGGTSADNHWSSASNWVGDVAPTAGATLLFPAGASQTTNVNDFAAGTMFSRMDVIGQSYQISGNAVDFAVGSTVDVGASNSATLALPIGGTGGLTLAAGTLVLSGANTFTGETTVLFGQLNLAGTAAPTVSGGLVINGVTAREMLDDQIADDASVAVNPGATFDLNGHKDTVGTFTVTGGTVLLGSSRLTAGPTTFDHFSTLSVTLAGATGSGGIVTNGTVSLDGTLQLTLAAPVLYGTPVILFDNDGSDPVSGRFINYNEGSLFNLGGTTFRFTYRGGAGQNDVAVTANDPLSGQISGTVFTDINGNGQYNSDPRRDGVLVQLDIGADGTVDQTTTTANGGLYSFSALPVGTFRVRIMAPGGTVQTTPDPNDFSLAIGQTVGNVGFGVFQLVSISGTKFNDRNGDGIRHNNEPGIGGVEVRLYTDPSSNPVQTVTTGTDGSFVFSGVGPGVFQVREVAPVGTTQTTADPADFATTSGTDVARVLFGNRVNHTELFAVGADAGGGPHVLVYNADGSLRFSFLAYGANFAGGVRVATGDVNGDGVDDIITAAGAGSGPHVKVFDGANLNPLQSFFAYSPTFAGGVFVATGDVNGDGFADIVTGAGAGGGPHVEVFSGPNHALLQSFFAYGSTFGGGVFVAAGDVNGDGFADIITGAGAGGGPHVEVFSGTNLSLLRSFMAFDVSFNGGVSVAAGDVYADGRSDLIIGAGAGGGPHVKVFSGKTGLLLTSFFADDASFRGGVRVAAGDVNGDAKADIIMGTGRGSEPRLRVMEAATLHELDSFLTFDPTFLGGLFVG
jgi:autotransporter-associated beta strand protein